MTYSETNLTAELDAQLDALQHPGPLTTSDTGLLDQYHAGGLAAVDKLIDSLGLTADCTVLDAGFNRVVNLTTSLTDGTLRIVRGLFSKPHNFRAEPATKEADGRRGGPSI